MAVFVTRTKSATARASRIDRDGNLQPATELLHLLAAELDDTSSPGATAEVDAIRQRIEAARKAGAVFKPGAASVALYRKTP